MFAVMCLLFNHLFVLFFSLIIGIKMTNKAGIPILGKKLDALLFVQPQCVTEARHPLFCQPAVRYRY